MELRIEGDEKPKIRGHAAVFERKSVELWGFKEKIRKGAFENSIKTSDVRALFNHDPNYVLGRNISGTLTLSENENGLYVEIDPPDTQWARDLQESIRRGDIDQMSFGFRTIKDEWDQADPNNVTRTLVEVELFDVSPVTYPAYPQTDVGIRSAEDVYKSFASKIQENQEAKIKQEQEFQKRQRELQILDKEC